MSMRFSIFSKTIAVVVVQEKSKGVFPMNRLENVKKLTVILPYVPAVIFFCYSLSFWRKGNASVAVICGLTGIGLILLSVALNTIWKIVDNDKRFMIVPTIVVFCCSLYIWVQGDIYYGLISTLIGLFMIANHFFYSQKGTGSKWSTPMWQIYIPIAVGVITFGPLLYLDYASEKKKDTVGKAAVVSKQIGDKSKKPNTVPGGKKQLKSSKQP